MGEIERAMLKELEERLSNVERLLFEPDPDMDAIERQHQEFVSRVRHRRAEQE